MLTLYAEQTQIAFQFISVLAVVVCQNKSGLQLKIRARSDCKQLHPVSGVVWRPGSTSGTLDTPVTLSPRLISYHWRCWLGAICVSVCTPSRARVPVWLIGATKNKTQINFAFKSHSVHYGMQSVTTASYSAVFTTIFITPHHSHLDPCVYFWAPLINHLIKMCVNGVFFICRCLLLTVFSDRKRELICQCSNSHGERGTWVKMNNYHHQTLMRGSIFLSSLAI